MRLLFPILTSLVALGLMACSSKPAATEEQNVSVAPQMPEATVTEPSATATAADPAPTTAEKTTKTTKKSTKKKKKTK